MDVPCKGDIYQIIQDLRALKGRDIASEVTEDVRLRRITRSRSCVTYTYQNDNISRYSTRYECENLHSINQANIGFRERAVNNVIGEIVSTGMILTNCQKDNESRFGLRCFFYRPQE